MSWRHLCEFYDIDYLYRFLSFLFFFYRVGIISSNLPIWKLKPLLALNLAIVPIDSRILNNMPEYVKISETFNKITKHIQLYQQKVEADQRDGSRRVKVNDD